MKKIIGILIVMMFVITIPTNNSMENINLENKYFENVTFRLNKGNHIYNIDNDSSKVLIDLNITGTAYGQELLWKANTTGTNYEESAVVYADGIAYIGSCSIHGRGHDRIFAVDTANGSIIWSTFIGPTYVGPVIDNNRIYIGSSSHGYDPTNDYIFCINRSDGSVLWRKKLYMSTPESIQYDQNNIYFSTYSILALNKGDGSIKWEYPLDGLSVTKPLLKDNAIFTAASGGTMYKVDAENGKKIWEVSIPKLSWDNSITSDGEGHIFLAIYNDESINSYDEDTGELLWRFQLHDKSFSFNAYHNNVVFISDLGGYVYAINASSGSLIWEKKIGNSCDICSPTISGGLLFIGTRDFCEGALFALNETSGDVLWKYPIGASVTAPPCIVDGMMICGTDDWHMYAFDFGIGTGDWPLHRYDTSNTAFSPNGLTEWQFVSASCNTINNITTCVVTNTYDHQVDNVKIKLPNGVSADWYNSNGNLIKSGSNYCMINYLSSQSSFSIILSNYKVDRPNKPTISGATLGLRGKEYIFTFTTNDPDNSEISYLIYWDDNSYTGWTQIQPSDKPLTLSHKWYEKDTYNVKAKVKNLQGIESEWSDPLPIKIPYFTNPLLHLQYLFLNRLFKQHMKHWFLDTSSLQLPISETWKKTFGGKKEDRGRSVQQTDDGGYIITGYSYSFGNGSFDVWLIKTDGNGNKLWDTTFGGKSADFGHSVQQTTDGGYIIAGSLAWDDSLYLIKTDSNGNMMWEKTLGGNGEEEGKSVKQTDDGGYIITGYTNSYGNGKSDVWLIKTDSNGNKMWDKTYGGTSYEYGTSVQQTADDGYIITGYTDSYGSGNNDVWIIKTDGNGNKMWDKTFGEEIEDRGYSIQQTTDGGYIILGLTYSYESSDVWLIKTDNNGNKMWDRTFRGIFSEHGNCVQQTTDGGYIITGWTDSFGNDFANVWLIKTDSNGIKIWDKVYGGDSMEIGDSVQQTFDGGYIILGSTMARGGNNIWLVKTDDQGRSKTSLFDTIWFECLFQRYPN